MNDIYSELMKDAGNLHDDEADYQYELAVAEQQKMKEEGLPYFIADEENGGWKLIQQ